MAYVAGDLITDGEYNAFLTPTSGTIGINHTMGTGATVYGLGQAELPVVQGGADSGTTVTAASWNALLTAMDNIGNHTNDTLTARTQVVAGDTIGIKAAIAADLVSLAAEVAGGSTSATALTTSSALQTVTTGSEGWDSNSHTGSFSHIRQCQQHEIFLQWRRQGQDHGWYSTSGSRLVKTNHSSIWVRHLAT